MKNNTPCILCGNNETKEVEREDRSGYGIVCTFCGISTNWPSQLKKSMERLRMSEHKKVDDLVMREFKTGATRDADCDKLDYEGFLSPIALRRYGEYMHAHRVQSDGKMRNSDNWQKGIPLDQYMKSLFRHMLEAWSTQRGSRVYDKKDGHLVKIDESLCGVLFNAFGYLHEYIKKRGLLYGSSAPSEEFERIVGMSGNSDILQSAGDGVNEPCEPKGEENE